MRPRTVDQGNRSARAPPQALAETGDELQPGRTAADHDDAGQHLHLARDRIPADAEVLQRALGLRALQSLRRNLDLAETVSFDAEFTHPRSPSSGGAAQ